MVRHPIYKPFRLHVRHQGITGLSSFNDARCYCRSDDGAGTICMDILDVFIHSFDDLAGFEVIIDGHFLTKWLQAGFITLIVNNCFHRLQMSREGPSLYLLRKTTLFIPAGRNF